MRLAIDARLWEDTRCGIGRYTRALIEALVRHAPREQWLLYSDRPLAGLPRGVELRCLPERRRLVWTLHDLPRALRRDPVDVYHSVTGFELPRGNAGAATLVATVHDLIPLRYPRAVPLLHRLAVRTLLPGALRRARHIIAVSKATRRELLDRYRIDPGKMCVIPEAAAPAFGCATAATRSAVRDRYGLRGGYLLFVGLIEPKKNLATLLRAMALLREWGALNDVDADGHATSRPLPLLIVGQPGWGERELPELVEELGIGECVRFLGPVPDSDLPALYAEATAFVFPSLWEGFGLPVVEAMASGTPVVASCRGALPEVAGDAALLVEPEPGPLAEAIARIVVDCALRARFREAGIRRAATYSWERTARETLGVYRRVRE